MSWKGWRRFKGGDVSAKCIECGKESEGDVWKAGEVLLFGSVFACSKACGEKFARENANPGYRPGEPGFEMEVHTDFLDCPDCEHQLHPSDEAGLFGVSDSRVCPQCKLISWVDIDDSDPDPDEHTAFVNTAGEHHVETG